ncbi:MAG: peptidylprolyl isomerase, partial [Devosia sp.]
AVIDVGRRHATQLPEAIAKELAGLNVGGITKPRVVETGVSMLAVCEKAQAEDLTFIKSDLRAEAGNDVLVDQSAAYMANLRKQAKIIYN